MIHRLFPELLVILILLLVNSAHGQVNIEKVRMARDTSGFDLSLGEHLVIKTGNTDFLNLGTDLQTVWKHGRYTTFLLGDYQQYSKDDQKFENKGFAHWRQGWRLNSKLELESYLQYGFDKARFLNSRHLIGAGLRTHFLSSALGISIMFEDEEYDQVASRKRTRGSCYITTSVFGDTGWEMSHTLYYQPNVEEFNDYRLLEEGVFAFPITELITFSTKINLHYDSKPVKPGVEELDLAIMNGVSFIFSTH